jgi:spore germination protein KB
MKVNQTECISYTQLFLLIFFFEIGSAVVIGVGDEAKQDAWIAVLLASFIGAALMFVYVKILDLSSQNGLYSGLGSLLGTKISKCITFVYVVYFLYIAARVLRDFIELVNTVIYPQTSGEIIGILFILTVMYYLYHGLEVSARSLVVFMPYIVSFLFLIVLFLWVNKSIDINRMRPIFADGSRPIIAAIYPELMTFPFGETVVFLCLMSYVQQKKQLFKVCTAAVIVSGVLLSFFTSIKLAVLGADLSSTASFPLLSAIRRISIADFLERLDALVVFVILVGIFIKVLLFILAALKGMEVISSIPYRFFILPVGGILSVLMIIIADNYAEHIQEGLQFVPYYIHLPLQYGIPIFLLIGLWVKKKLGGKHSEAG